MGVAPLALCAFLATILTTFSVEAAVPDQIDLLWPDSTAAGHQVVGVNCLSWRLAVEANNMRSWDVVPAACEEYIGNYMTGHQYSKDGNTVVYQAYTYAKSLKLKDDGKDIWVFDVDDTALTNLPYYMRPEVSFGVKPFNETAKNEWLATGKLPPMPAVLWLYKRLLPLGFKITFISATSESLGEVRITNLKNAGYHTWEKLLLKQAADKGTTSVVYKSKKRKELEAAGYRILGNFGDQWSDLQGTNVGNRTFKFPNPMYYVN